MGNLYNKLARIYHEMYQSIFDYAAEFKHYDEMLKRYGATRILELGCGSGSLAKSFIKAGYDYTGLDLSPEMLEIAREQNRRASFVQGDMRGFSFDEKFDAIIITGRSIAYMTTGGDVLGALRSIHDNLTDGGVLAFDAFHADGIFENFKESFSQTAEFGGRHYRRESKSAMCLETGWTWTWSSKYYAAEGGSEKFIGDDSTVLRAFTEDEIKLFLKIAGFVVKEIAADGSLMNIESLKNN